MNSFLLIGIFLSIILGLSSFVASNNFIVGIVILLLCILYFLFFANKMFKKYQTKIKRFHQCYHFINSFITSLSVNASLTSAYDSAVQNISLESFNEIENIDSLKDIDKLEHLGKYFRFNVYSLFLDLIHIYEEQGGDILKMSHYLLNELRLVEEYLSESEIITKKKLIEFIILWILTIGIMVFLRFVLSYFFDMITKHIFYPIGIGVICLFCLLSIHLAITRITKIEIKGWNDDEKI